jgi:ABC-2 type transport system ATP-binding protein
MIQIDGLWKTYDTVIAIRDFSLTVAGKQTVGLIGPNGSGKTTLLRMISTLSKPDTGTIRVCGFDALDEPREVRRRISFMPAEFGFPLDLSILEYMDYFACASGVPRRERRRVVDQVLQLTDLKGREDVIVRGLSTGNRQRLLLAKTLVSDPEILLLDEPASGLDPRARAELRALLKELADMGKTIVISSHILADIEDICTSVCILEEGKRVLSGQISGLRTQFASPDKIVRLKVPEAEIDRVVGFLSQLDGVLRCVRERDELHVASAYANCNYILKALIDLGVEVLEVHEVKPDLEDIFLETTKGVVS